MGRIKKRFNPKARQVAIEPTRAQIEEISSLQKVVSDHSKFGTFDQSNALVVSSVKSKRKPKISNSKTKILSNKQKKKLKKVLDSKKKKEKVSLFIFKINNIISISFLGLVHKCIYIHC